MATYNGEMFIKRQLQSILNQLAAQDEIIISDDGSQDATIEIIRTFMDNRIKLFLNKGRKGPTGNFQNALSKAKGDFIFLSDQDDIWLPDKVKIVINLLQVNDLVLTDCKVVDGKEGLIHSSFFAVRGSKSGFWHNIYRNSYIGCCMAFRRDVLSYVLPFPEKVHMHDWWIGLLVEIRGKVYFYPKPMIHYIRHGNNASPTGGEGYSLVKKISNRFWLILHLIIRSMP